MKTHQFMMNTLYVLLSFSLIFGCGKKAGQQQQQQSAPGTENKSNDPLAQMQKAAEDMNKAMTGDQKPVPAVPFKSLEEVLPASFMNMKTEGPSGETATYGEWNYSSAKINFEGDNGIHADIEVLDYAHIGLLYAPFQMLFNMKFSREDSKGYEKSTKYGNYPAYEKWESAEKHMEITVLVGERFVVNVKSTGLDGSAAKDLLSKIDLNKLAGMKAS